ncbi:MULTISPECIES: MMPL family transporter [Microbacterium]|uniref:MMPL family transporter n=1 Tax=Microbacterium TaxID=33882 RepID=UPI00278775A5|nr:MULTISPECIES: MMPL family transporter [Microbacterium]MDQ1085151.1 RND superfamily putative drug exporter [Microbacterium sp. SORGH_AS_0344]MDQ1169543.1 RND superfamily putative drug exporter [Microbacterium proteolyticum]
MKKRILPALMVTAWAVVAVVAALSSSNIEQTFKEVSWTPANSQSSQVDSSLAKGFTGSGATSFAVVVTDHDHEAGSPEFARRVSEVADALQNDPEADVTSIIGYSNAGQARSEFLGKDDRTALFRIGSSLDANAMAIVVTGFQDRLSTEFDSQGLTVQLVGTSAFLAEMTTASSEGLGHAEFIALPVIVIVLLVLYGSVAATLLSLAASGIAIITSLGIVDLIGQSIEMSNFTLNSVTMLGLGVCVDYTLFVVRRFQRQLAEGDSPGVALRITMRTAGEAVLASGLTIAIAMSALFLVDSAVIRSIAIGIVVVVLLSVSVALILVPAALALLGYRVNWIRMPRVITGRRGRASTAGPINPVVQAVQRRPVVSLVAGAAVLAALAIPGLHLSVGGADAGVARTDSAVRQGFTTIAEQFSVGATAPISVLIRADEGSLTSLDDKSIVALQDAIAASENVDDIVNPIDMLSQISPQNPLAATSPEALDRVPTDVRGVLTTAVSADGDRLLLTVLPNGSATSDTARQALLDIRGAVADHPIAGATIRIGGETAMNEESTEIIEAALPGVVALMLAVILALLVLTFRSVLVPLVTVALNVLSVGATFGILVLVFQHGLLTELMGMTRLGHLINWVPVLLIALLFSLATDYQVFILSTIREHFRAGRTAREAVARGMSDTAPIITGAALLMVVVFGAFAFTGVVPIQQFGFGLAIGVLLDATIVRMVLVPATLTLLGKASWWPGSKTTAAAPAPSAAEPALTKDA